MADTAPRGEGDPEAGSVSGSASGAVRVDIWLWRARFAKSRSLAAALVERGAVRLTHQGRQTRLDKPSRLVHPGDDIVFAYNDRLTAVHVVALGERRGPPIEARALYREISSPQQEPPQDLPERPA